MKFLYICNPSLLFSEALLIAPLKPECCIKKGQVTKNTQAVDD